MKTKLLILPLVLLFIFVSNASLVDAASPKPPPKNLGQGVKQLRKDTNAAKKTIQQERKTGTITKQQAKTEKKALQQQFQTKKQELKKKELKPKATPKLSPKPKKAPKK